MSALTYFSLSKRHHMRMMSFLWTLLPLLSLWGLLPSVTAEAAQPSPSAASAPVQKEALPGGVKAPPKVNSAHAPQISEEQKAAAEKKAQDAKKADNAKGSENAAAENTSEEAAPALPESTSLSAGYVKTFEASGKRDPFSERGKGANTEQTDTSWWQEAAESGEEEVKKAPGELHFDGRTKPTHASYARLPNIKVTGLMQVGGRRAVSAIIQNKGSCILFESDNVVISDSAKANLTKSLTIKKIHLNELTVILDDGIEITGKFY